VEGGGTLRDDEVNACYSFVALLLVQEGLEKNLDEKL
jgi:hypothetical protein